jgi:hypothetical protein
MPEPETTVRFSQNASGTCLINRREQVRHGAAEHEHQIRDREVSAKQSRLLQHLTHWPAHEAEAVRYGPWQGAWRGAGLRGRGSRFGDDQA